MVELAIVKALRMEMSVGESVWGRHFENGEIRYYMLTIMRFSLWLSYISILYHDKLDIIDQRLIKK